MIKQIINSFSTIIYVQIWETRIKAVDINSGDCFDEKPLVAIETTSKSKKIVSAIGNNASLVQIDNNTVVTNPFSHPRVLFSDFQVGEKLLQHIFRKLIGRKLFSPSPAVVMHPMEKTEGGLTMIEKRAFRELALGAGAREVVAYEGAHINTHNFNYPAIKSTENYD